MITLMKRMFHVLNKPAINTNNSVLQLMVFNLFHTRHQWLYNKDEMKHHVAIYPFHALEKKEKETFLDIIRLYTMNKVSDRGCTDFIAIALKYMDEFGVNKDLEVYKALLDILPKGKYIPTNIYQIMLMHYPRQQDIALEVLTKMEDNKVMPDREMEDMLLNIFGMHGLPLKKYWRMMYWMPKFAHLNPWPVPSPTPKDPRVLSQFAMKKIGSVDVQAKVTEYLTKDLEDSLEDTWIVSVMSKSQEDLLKIQPTNEPLTIEGPFNVWIANHSVDYFVLRGKPLKRDVVFVDTDDVSNMEVPLWNTKGGIPVTIHEEEYGVNYAMCATGTSSKNSLLSWIRCLQKRNPILEKIPVVFKLKSRADEPGYIENKERKNISDTEASHEQLSDGKR